MTPVNGLFIWNIRNIAPATEAAQITSAMIETALISAGVA